MEQNAGFDSPSLLDWKYEDLFGTVTTIPHRYIGAYIPVTDQSLQPESRMACSRYGMGGIAMAQGIRNFDCLAFWLRYTKVNPEAIKVGATLQSALAQGRTERIIVGNVLVSTQDQARDAISKDMFVYTGSLYGNRRHVRETGIYAEQTIKGGHIFFLIGYDMEGFFAVNSYGKDNGIFYIPNEYFDNLYTKYAIMTDAKLADAEKEKRDEEDMALAYKYVMSPAEPERPLLRKDAAKMFGRFIRLIKPELEQ